jgi:hypothetical protein
LSVNLLDVYINNRDDIADYFTFELLGVTALWSAAKYTVSSQFVSAELGLGELINFKSKEGGTIPSQECLIRCIESRTAEQSEGLEFEAKRFMIEKEWAILEVCSIFWISIVQKMTGIL